MVEQVEEFSPEIQPHSFPWNKVLDDREIGVHETRTGKRRPICISELPSRRLREATGVKPPGKSRIAQHGIARLIGTDKALSIVVLEICSGCVAAIDNEYRKSRGRLFDDRSLPASHDGISRPVPCVSPFPAFAERQLINDAGREIVVQVDLRKPPIQCLPIRERKV